MSTESMTPETEVVEATVVDDTRPAAATDIAVRSPAGGELVVTPAAEASELVARLDVIRDAMDNAMTEGVDYGVIPGTNKPTLMKPGAEKLNVLFQLDIQLTNEQTHGPGDHLTVTSRAVVFHAPTGKRLGYGEGLCSTREKKYAKRQGERVCPDCGKPAIIKGKAEYGGGFLCWARKDGCGAKFTDTDQRITGQQVGEVENPDLPDLWNTVLKMAEKRARVDAVLAVTGASALFTQDVEDSAAAAAAEGNEASAGVPAWAELLEDENGSQCKALRQAFGRLVGDPAKAAAVYTTMREHCGGVPASFATTIIALDAARTGTAVPS